MGVVGAGIAGLTAAISLAWRGFEVIVFYVGDLRGSNSYRAQAGMALPVLEGDSVEMHVTDTLQAGRFLNDLEAVWSTIAKASEAYDFLASLGVEFDSVELEGGHSRPRVFSIRNETGRHIVEALTREGSGFIVTSKHL